MPYRRDQKLGLMSSMSEAAARAVRDCDAMRVPRLIAPAGNDRGRS